MSEADVSEIADGSKILVRAAGLQDLPAIVALWRQLQEINAAFDPRLTLSSGAADWFAGYLQERIDTPSMAVLVADHKSLDREPQVIGYAFGQVMQRPTLESGDCGYIADICVRDGWRGRGIGRALHDRLRGWFRAQGIEAIEVQIVRANPAAQAFWRKMGYKDFLRTLRSD